MLRRKMTKERFLRKSESWQDRYLEKNHWTYRAAAMKHEAVVWEGAGQPFEQEDDGWLRTASVRTIAVAILFGRIKQRGWV